MPVLRLYSLVILAGLLIIAPATVHPKESPEFTTPFKFTPFTRELTIPPTVKESAPFEPRCSMDLPEGMNLGPTRFYTITMRQNTVQIIPGVDTAIWGYDGHFPGPTFKVKHFSGTNL